MKEIIKNLIIIFLIIILLEVGYSKFIEKEYPVNLFGFSFLIVTTGSMEPEINSGELAIIKDSEQYLVNDVVSFIDEDGFLITHRIIEENNGNILTKGDANNLNDEITSIKNIKGKVVFHSKILGIFAMYLLKPLIFIYLTIVIILEVKERKNNSNEKNLELKERKSDCNENNEKENINCSNE